MKLKRRIFSKSPFKVSERLRFQRLSLLFILLLVFLLLGPLGIIFKSTQPDDYKSAQQRRVLLEKVFSYLGNAETNASTPAEANRFLVEHFELEEKIHADLTVGAEKKVIFPPGTELARAPLGLIYFHGFQANRQEISPVIEDVSQKLAAPVFFSRVKYHGVQGDNFQKLKIDDYLEAVSEAKVVGQYLADELVLVGMSTGAPMAMLMAAQSKHVKALVLLSPNFGLPQWNWKLAIGPLGNLLSRLVLGGEYKWTPKNDQQAMFWNYRVHSDAIRPMVEMVVLGKRAGTERTDWSQVSVLLVQNPLDRVIDNQEARDYLAQFEFARFETFELPSDNHIFAGQILQPQNTPILVDRIQKFLSPTP